jgi:hypothetical protein
MHKALLWLGAALCVVGVAVIVASAVLTSRGVSATYNLGDPGKFQFILVPLWQIGLAIAAVGAVCLLGRRWLRAGAQ